MKIWIALSKDHVEASGWYAAVSFGALCPPLTLEMVQDNRAWYEAEITRQIKQEPKK